MFTLVVDWGDVPTWISAITTLGALVAAGWLVTIELRRESRAVRMLHDQAEEQKRKADREAAEDQASRVGAWRAPKNGPKILVRNATSLPIYDVALHLSDSAGQVVRISGPRLIPPGDQYFGFPVSIVKVDEYGDGADNSDAWDIMLVFTDAGRRRWARDGLGRLIGPHASDWNP